MKSNREPTGTTRPPEPGVIPRHIPRGVEVLIKKAAVDPAFKKLLFEKRAGAAEAIGLKLTAAEEAMLAAVPLPQLEGIVAHTRVSPGLRPAFLGYAAGAMLAVLGTTILVYNPDRDEPTKTRKLPGTDKVGAGGYKIPYPATRDIITGNGYGIEGLGTLGIRPSRLKKTTGRTRRRAVRPSVSAGARPYEVDRSPRGVDVVVQRHLLGIENAYNSNLKANPNLGTGKIIIKFTVAPEGDVTSAQVVNDTLGAPGLCTDIISIIKSWRFPRVGGGDVTVIYPFVFVPEAG